MAYSGIALPADRTSSKVNHDLEYVLTECCNENYIAITVLVAAEAY